MLLLLIGPIVIWRLTHMIQEEAGPFAVFYRLDAWLATRTNTGAGSFYDGWTCFKCLSVWLSLVYAAFLPIVNDLLGYVAVVLFLSGVAIFINLVYNKLEET